jgi:hypothetical protein
MNCSLLPARARRPLVRTFAALAAVGACLLVVAVPRSALAQQVYYGPPPPPPPPGYRYYEADREPPFSLALALDLEGAFPVNLPRFLDGNDLTGGGGFKVRVGEQIRLRGGVRITPEVGYGYEHLFASDDIGDSYSWDIHRLFGGVRLAFGHFVTPVLYGHVGYGWRVTDDPTVPQQGGLTLDAGGALDFHVAPHLTLGVHLEYATLNDPDYGVQWVAAGVHGALVF